MNVLAMFLIYINESVNACASYLAFVIAFMANVVSG